MAVKMSETEYEIMQLLWQLDEPISTSDVMEYYNLKFKKGWKMQTVSTFLTRLVDKGLVKSERVGRRYFFRAVMTEEEYISKETRSFLESSYQGSLYNFLSALSGGEKLNAQEAEELKKWLDEKQ